MCHEYLMSTKAGNPAKELRRTNAPTVGPDTSPQAHKCPYSMLKVNTNKPPHDKTNKMSVRQAKLGSAWASAQSAVRSMGSREANVSSCGKQRLIRLGGCSG